ncbi:hypothetical protein BBJ28_00018100 [Nothophytophthora sp. Chile5]|nr:hypothetical protein BBJ28_00018100 [Nothophytophthora sp. Chile5]
MSLAKMRSMLADARRRRRRGYGSSLSSDVQENDLSLTQSEATQQSDDLDFEYEKSRAFRPPSDAEMLERARDAHTNVDFRALAAGPEHGGPWLRVEAADRFVVFQRHISEDSENNASLSSGFEVLCAGRLDASLEEVASILCPRSGADHNAAMTGLYAKNFIFGSLERSVPCSGDSTSSSQSSDNPQKPVSSNEQLTVKTSSFMRTALFAHNEQWCYLDFFQRKVERDGFTLSQHALPPQEATPGRVLEAHNRVDQLHDLSTSYLVDLLPGRKGLRVVFHAWFEPSTTVGSYSSRTTSSRSSHRRSSASGSGSRSSASGQTEISETKAQLRRLLALAHGVTKLPELIRRRRFGVQVPADLTAIQVSNPRCPCCTRSLASVKLSLAKAASVFSSRSRTSVNMNTRRCYLCGYLVCGDCWRSEHMDSTTGRVAAIVVCRRCHACVDACDYSEVRGSDNQQYHGPARVIADPPEALTAPLLVDFLAASLTQDPAERAAVLSVVRTMLQQSQRDEEDDEDTDEEDEGFCCEQESENIAVVELGKYLDDETQLPLLEACPLANAERRVYVLDLPDEPVASVPCSPIPDHESTRLAAAKASGLLLLANQLAPLQPAPEDTEWSDVRDLDLLCQLAVRALGCSYAFVTVMGSRHNHVLAGTHPGFAHAAVPREQTMCQHTIMTPQPLVITHPEADVRFHAMPATKQLPVRFYVGFPVTAPTLENNQAEVPVGTLCCIHTQHRAELTRSQYTTMKRLAITASQLLQLKGRRLQQQMDVAVAIVK